MSFKSKTHLLGIRAEKHCPYAITSLFQSLVVQVFATPNKNFWKSTKNYLFALDNLSAILGLWKTIPIISGDNATM